jgi:hypothetical protein
MNEVHTMIVEKIEGRQWRGWIDAFPTTRVEAATKNEVEEALELLWAKLWTPRMFESDPSEKTEPIAITLMTQADEG